MIKVVLFDLDDTLISEYDYIRSGYKYIATLLSPRLNISQDILYKRLLTLFHQENKNVFNRLLDDYKILYTSSNIMALVSIYRKHEPELSFYSDVVATLKVLKTDNIYTGIISDGYSVAQRNKLAAVNATEYFNRILLTDELGREYWKPSPRAFELMKEYFNVSFNEIMYVGDNPEKDFYISNFYPITTVRIYRKNGIYRGNSYYNDIKENYLIQSLQELEELLKQKR